MRHKLCRSFHPWCPGVKTRCLSANERRPYMAAGQGWGQFNSGIGIAAQFQFQFRNWNWNWNWWNWKWNWNWKPWNWNSEEVIIFHVTDSSCNRCSWDTAPLWCGHQRYMGRVPCSPWVARASEGLKMVTKNITYHHDTNKTIITAE